jgi:TonB family protein
MNQGIKKKSMLGLTMGPAICLMIGLAVLPDSLHAEVRVGHMDAVKNALKRPNPEYSPMARQMRIQGDVEVEVKIAESGEVADVKVITGNPMLSATVVKAIKDWKFSPFTESGKPTSAVANLKFTFKQ